MKAMLSHATTVAASALIFSLSSSPARSFSTSRQRWSNCRLSDATTSALFAGPTTIPKPDTDVDKELGSADNDIVFNQGNGISGPLEYNIDDMSIDRGMDQPFHILLLDETFLNNDKMTIEYAASSCVYVLDMPYDEAAELCAFAQQEGISCLGTWPREECLSLGSQLQQRDLVVRVVPFVEGGKKGWQARDASDNDGAVEWVSKSDAGGGRGGGGGTPWEQSGWE